MKFSPDQEVTPNTTDFKILSVTEEIPLRPEFWKVYTVQGYNPNILCGHGRPVFYLKEFPPTYIFCETSFDALPKLKLCDLPAGVTNSNNKAMGKKKHIADSQVWYPGKTQKEPKPEVDKKPKFGRPFRPVNQCPCCMGSGHVNDRKTNELRSCAICGGHGVLGPKPS